MQRAVDKTENMKARADAVSELEQAGTFDDITQLGGGEDDIDRQLKQLSSQPAVDDDLAKLKAELGTGGGETPQIAPGGDAGASAPAPSSDGGQA
jgi:phage shock protein A